MKWIRAMIIMAILLSANGCNEEISMAKTKKSAMANKWSAEKAWQWYNEVGVIRGCNYIPRTAVNSTEMWQGDSFDPETIDQELGWAKKSGYNSVRVFLQFVVWRQEPEAFKERLDTFLSLAEKNGISVMLVPFCDCQFSGTEPFLGKQDKPIQGVHNSRWMASPGHKTAHDPKSRPILEKYIKDIIGSFASDKRILLWDMYNEPGMSGAGEKSFLLVEDSFVWAREVNPTQPITVGAYQTSFDDPAAQRFMELSDVVTFHSYDDVSTVEKKIEICKNRNRPVLCTEFMIRRNGNDLFACLPVFSEHKVGWYNWGLVAGKTQTYMPWGTKEGSPIPKRWQHDILYTSGLPYDPKEIELIRNYGFFDEVKTILPTSENELQMWNYIMDTPDYGWHLGGKFNYKRVYQGTTWKQGEGGFGTENTPFGYIKTTWSSNNVWLRKTFDLKEKTFNPYLRIRHDEEFEVYINGELAAKSSGYNTFYEYIPFSQRARAALKQGENIISVHCHKATDSRGGQYIDVGIVDIVVPKDSAYYVKPLPETEYEIDTGDVWSAEKAWKWYKKIGPVCGANFLPSTAANSTEMWQKESFDPETIDRELKWAHDAGYNSMRVFLQYIVWEDDPAGFLNRLDKYLEISDRNGISTMPIFFDDCCWAMKQEPLLGRQDDSLPGAHNTGWVPSPGYSMVLDKASWSKLERFVKDVVSRFKDDKRILVWDVYNEPGPGFTRDCTSHDLVKATFGWIRQVNPVQPVTVGSFANPRSMELHQYSDVISHHDYGSAGLKKFFEDIYKKHKRPVFITECMIRGGGGDFTKILPIYSKYNAGWYNWGLVAGRSQCYNYMNQPLGTTIPKVWCCEVFWPDGKPYDPEEIKLIKNFRFQELPDDVKTGLPQSAR